MTISEIYDRLLAAPVHRIEWRDGSSPLNPIDEPLIVADLMTMNVLAQAWIAPTPEGLVLHFNASTRQGARPSGQEEPLANILRIE